MATYDKEGKLLRTAEKYKNIRIPQAVSKAIYLKHPGWIIAKDAYLVNYYESEGAKKMYRLVLEKGDKRLRVKTDENGNFD